MCEKICEKTKVFFNPVNLLGLFGFFWFFYPGIENFFANPDFVKVVESNAWVALATIFIAIFTFYQAKYTKYSIRPVAYLLLLQRKDNLGKDQTFIYVRNESKYKILFNLRVSVQNGEPTNWREEPLHVYPGINQYPHAMPSTDIINKQKEKNEEISIKLEYKIASSHAVSEVFTDYLVEKWKFDGTNWTGPNGIEAESIRNMINFWITRG